MFLSYGNGVRRVLVEFVGDFCYIPSRKVHNYNGRTDWLFLPE